MALAVTSNDFGTHLGRGVSAAVTEPATAGALVCMLLAWCSSACALDPSLDVSQYAHTSWTFRNGFLNGAVYTISQSPDGYLWLGTQTGVYRFDGVRAVPLPLPGLGTTEVGTLLPARDGTLWIGTLDGLVSSKNGQLTEHPSLGRRRVNALLEDRDGTVWAGTALGGSGRLCAVRRDSTECYGADGGFGAAVQSLYEDSNGNLWVGARSGLWRWKPGPPIQSMATPVTERQSLAQGDHQSGLVVALGTGGIRQVTGTSVTDYPVQGVPSSLDATRPRRCAMYSNIRALPRSRSSFATMRVSFGYGFGTMGRASIRRSSPAAAGKDILGCAACASAQSSLAANSRCGRRAPHPGISGVCTEPLGHGVAHD
jgi:hypothetical protein